MTNPYQSSFPDEFLDENNRDHNRAIKAHEELIGDLRNRIRELEADNQRLAWQLSHLPVAELISASQGSSTVW